MLEELVWRSFSGFDSHLGSEIFSDRREKLFMRRSEGEGFSQAHRQESTETWGSVIKYTYVSLAASYYGEVNISLIN